eukprot:COSAG01_NODE_31210_length_601_cov_3.278884_1_plen_69_part_10
MHAKLSAAGQERDMLVREKERAEAAAAEAAAEAAALRQEAAATAAAEAARTAGTQQTMSIETQTSPCKA